MKKALTSFLIASVLFTGLPTKKAEASFVLITAATLITGGEATIGKSRLVDALVIGGVSSLVLGAVLIPASVVGYVFVVLDADGSLPKERLAQGLSERYSFINDAEVISQLAEAISFKASTQEVVDGKIEVKLPSEVVRAILEPTDLMETHPDEVKQMMNELN